ncbi:myb-binding protein 1A-like protein [Salvelinus sp. IW2-2015]|uniref:myb-binding protein 1A-like protein n=1 Tax=Salvelinus sp. IW2-2015 TaxID=2691554 RepID=UPI0038D432A6
MVDILSETSEEVFEEVLLGALQTDLSSAFSTPEQLQLLLVAMQKFPQVLKLKKLKKLLGTSTIITMDNIPNYLSYRLLGSALPLLTLAQLKQVLNGEVMRAYGEHVVSAQLPDRFKFAPEMETYIGDFLQGCDDPEKQLAVMVAFSLLTNQGYPVVPSFWRVVQHLQPTALQSYVDWLKDMFLNPRLDSCLDFSTRRQKENQEGGVQRENCIFRLRKWIIPRLTSIAENNQVKREEALVMDVARFVFFHVFFNAKKATPDILETEATLSVPLDEKARVVIINSFFGLLQHINHLPLLGDSPEVAARNQRHVQGVTADGSMWIFCLVRYADTLLNQPKYAQSTQPFSPEQRQAWDRYGPH